MGKEKDALDKLSQQCSARKIQMTATTFNKRPFSCELRGRMQIQWLPLIESYGLRISQKKKKIWVAQRASASDAQVRVSKGGCRCIYIGLPEELAYKSKTPQASFHKGGRGKENGSLEQIKPCATWLLYVGPTFPTWQMCPPLIFPNFDQLYLGGIFL